jgi:hypothetical protein
VLKIQPIEIFETLKKMSEPWVCILVFVLPAVNLSVRWINRFMHLRWVRSRLDALEYRLYRLFNWLQRRGFLLID